MNVMCLAQTTEGGIIRGKIILPDGKPAAFATVTLQQHRNKTVADNNGIFMLQKLETLKDTLVISGIGFIELKLAVTIVQSQVIDAGIVKVEYDIAQLQDVEIIGRMAKSYKSDYSFFGTKTQTQLNRIPQSLSTVTKELTKDKMNFHLRDAADDVAGVTHYSGYEEYTIRGFRAENAHLINGLRTYNTTFTSPLLVNIERVEILKGPSSVLYGNADPGGVINLVTKKPLQQKEYTIDLFAGSWNAFHVQADATGPLIKNKNLLYRFNGGYENTKSFRNQYFSKSFEVAPSLSYMLNNKLKLNVDVTISDNNTVVDRGQPGFNNDKSLNSTPINLMVTQPGDYLKETNITSILSLSYKLNDRMTFNSAYLNYNTKQHLSEHGLKDYITNDSVYLYYTNRKFNTVTNTISNYLNFQFTTGRLNHQLLAGYDFIKSYVSINQWQGELVNEFGEDSHIAGTFSLRNPVYLKRPLNDYESVTDDDDFDAEQYYTNGIYVQEQIMMNKWLLLASLREEFYSGTGDDGFKQSALLPRIGLVYAATTNVSIYATYSKGFDPFETSSAVQVFNAPFKPIYSNMMEAGTKIDLFKNKLFATASVYGVTLKNVAVNANDPDNPDLFVQRGKERATGFETELNGNISPALSVSVTYAYNIAKVIESDKPGEAGMVKENAPCNLSSSFIKYTKPNKFLKGFGFSVGHSQTGKRNTLDENIVLPAYFIFNTGAHYVSKNYTVAVMANNVTDKKYYTSAYNNINKWPGAPRNFTVRFTYTPFVKKQ